MVDASVALSSIGVTLWVADAPRRLTAIQHAEHIKGSTQPNSKANKCKMDSATKTRSHGRGRPSVERVKSIDNSIIEAATKLFLRDGFDLVTMEAIAVATPLSKTTLYSRFASKEILLAAVIEDRIEKWSAASAEHDHEMPDDLEGRMLYHARAVAGSMLLPEVRGFVRLSYLLSERFPEIAKTFHDEGNQYIVEFIRRDIEHVAKRDNFTVRDAKSVAEHFVSAIVGWNMEQASRGGPSESEAFAAASRITELFVAGRGRW